MYYISGRLARGDLEKTRRRRNIRLILTQLWQQHVRELVKMKWLRATWCRAGHHDDDDDTYRYGTCWQSALSLTTIHSSVNVQPAWPRTLTTLPDLSAHSTYVQWLPASLTPFHRPPAEQPTPRRPTPPGHAAGRPPRINIAPTIPASERRRR